MLRVLPLLFLLSVLVGCGEDTDPTRPNTFVPLTAIEASVEPAAVPVGLVARMTVFGDFSGQFSREITDSALITSADPAVASVGPEPGAIIAVAPGTVTFTAEAEGLSATVDFTVTNATIASLALTPSSLAVPAGISRRLAAEGAFSDAAVFDLTAQAQWNSSDPAVATAGNGDTAGVVAAVAPGTATVTATFDGVSSAAEVTVSEGELTRLEVAPADPDLPAGFSRQFTATVFFSDAGSEDVTAQSIWDTSNTAVASISNAAGRQGLATASEPGTVEIKASFEGRESATTLTVTDALLESLDFAADLDIIPLGTPTTFSVTGFFADGSELDLTEQVSFTSSDPGIAEVGDSDGFRGVVTPIAAGTFTLTAERDGFTVSRDITVQ